MKKYLALFLVLIMIAGVFPVTFVSAAEPSDTIQGWNAYFNGGVDAVVKQETEDNGNGYVSVQSFGEMAPNRFMSFGTNVPVEYGKTYVYGYSLKGEDLATSVPYFSINWEFRRPCAQFASTFGWTKYEFLYSPPTEETTTMGMMFNMEGFSGKLGIDNVYCYEYKGGKVGDNLIANSTFDAAGGGKVETPSEAVGLEAKIENMKNSANFVEPEIESLYGGLRYTPVYPAKNITVDGDLSDWEDYPKVSLPTLASQYTIYFPDVTPDVTGEFRYAWDEENFYMAVDVKDDKHEGYLGGGYWTGDSIQLSFAEEGKTLTEVGLTADNEGNCEIIADIPEDAKNASKLKTTQTADGMIYEFSMPWTAYYEKRPESILFNALLNDNDGKGRAYCMEFSPGIGTYKGTDKNPRFAMVDETCDYDTWLEGPRELLQNAAQTFDLYYVNRGDAKDVKIEIPAAEIDKTVKLGTDEGIHEKFDVAFADKGEQSVVAKITTDGKTDEIVYKVNVTVDFAIYNDQYFKSMKKKGEELDKLLEECIDKEIPVDYEKADVFIYNRYVNQMEKEKNMPFTDRLEYYDYCLQNLYTEAKERLTGLLDGTREGEVIPQYVSGDVKIDGRQLIGTMDMGNGEEEQRPAQFVGVLGFGEDRADLPNYHTFGFNANSPEIGPDSILKKPGSIPYWSFGQLGGHQGTFLNSDEAANGGTYSAKLTSTQEVVPNSFSTATQAVTLKPNTTYHYGLYAKAEDSKGVWFSIDGWNDMRYINGTHDWTNYDFVFKTGDEPKKTEFRIAFDSPIGAVYLDDIYVREGEDGPNLIQNGDFETVMPIEDGYAIDMTAVERFQEFLQEAEDNNVMASVLLSSHYMPQWIFDMNSDMRQPDVAGGFFRFELTHPEARRALAKYYEVLIPQIKDYACVTNFILANEPSYNSTYSDYNLPLYHEYLAGVYENDISKLNAIYGENYASFDEVGWPMDPDTRAPVDDGSVHFYDWVKFNRKVLTDFHIWMRDEVAKYAPEIPVSTKTQNHFGGTDWRDPRFMGTMSGTDFEGLTTLGAISGNDAWWMRGQPQSGPNEKLFYYDAQRCAQTAPIMNTEDHIIGDGDRYYGLNNQHASHMYTDIWQGAIHGRNNSVIWVWGTSYDPAGTDGTMVGHLPTRPDCVQKVGEASMDLNKLAYEVKDFQNNKADVAVLYSDASRIYSTNHMGAAFGAYNALLFDGEKVDVILETQAEKLKDYKMIVLPHVNNIPAKALAEVKEAVDAGAKVIITGSDNVLKFDEHKQPNDEATVQYIRDHSTIMPGESQQEFRKILKEIGLYNVEIINTKTGAPAENTEYMTVEKDDKVLINICNYLTNVPQEVKILVDGKEITESKDLIHNVKCGSTMTLNPWDPVMIEIKK